MVNEELVSILKNFELFPGPPDFPVDFDSTYFKLIISTDENLENYVLSKISERKETRKLGENVIPRKGKVIRYADNDNWDEKELEFKSRYPELETKNPSIILEKIREVKLIDNSGLVELLIDRYLIQEKYQKVF
ncbi:MAG TPA: hypothetical protein VJJ23_05955 [Candidatus Nanoarchaeia archaeon]|nr:hypothetical protein [Candidatus Nanoarchaeia archaeon]